MASGADWDPDNPRAQQIREWRAKRATERARRLSANFLTWPNMVTAGLVLTCIIGIGVTLSGKFWGMALVAGGGLLCFGFLFVTNRR